MVDGRWSMVDGRWSIVAGFVSYWLWSRPFIPHALWLAGVWGEASPQAPPEARWTAGRSRGASQPWAGGREMID